MNDDLGPRIFDLDKLESLELESERNLRSSRPTRRAKKANTAQLDLFSQALPKQETSHANADQISGNGERITEPEVRREDGTSDPEALADIRIQAGGSSVDEAVAEESLGAESQRASRSSDGSDGGEPRSGAGENGSLGSSDEAGGRREGRSGSLGHDAGGISEPAVSFAFEENAETAKPSRDYRITAESHIGEGGLRKKAELNLDAIQLLKVIEADGRQATDDEKHVLARYTGWGALPAVFDYYTGREDEWGTVRDTVRAVLSEEEYNAARASVSNAHYTSPIVVEAIWSALKRFGIGAGTRILEPSIGTGNFFGLMPEALMPRTLRIGVELDSITARIAKQLYPDSVIFESSFEEAPFPDNFFDVAIGNVPFGNYGVHDPKYKAWQTESIHDYFFVKTLDKLREGGVLAFITSRYTMDKKDDIIRRHLASKADLIGAIRLPNTSFKDNAGTVVTTDIIFLQKRASGQERIGLAWENVQDHMARDRSVFSLNEYYVQKPEMMLGEMQSVHSRYGRQPELIGEITADNLQAAIAKLPRDIYAPCVEKPSTTITQPTIDEGAFVGIKNGAYVIVDGVLGVREDGQFTPVSLKAKAEARVRGMMKIRDHVRAVFQTQLADNTDEIITQARRNLNYAYDSFLAKFGCLSSRENVRAFSDDPDAPLLLSLEESYDEVTGKAAKAAIFTRRTLDRYRPVVSVETAAEALAVSLNEYGRLDWQRMSAVTGRSLSALQQELGSLVYDNPETGAWETADEYLSGNVRQKLATARAAAALDKKYQRNIMPLEGVQPVDLAPSEITARLGSTWVPTDDLADFVSDVIEAPSSAVRVDYVPELAAWSITAKEFVKANVANTTTYGTARFTAIHLIEEAMNGKPAQHGQRNLPSVTSQRQALIAFMCTGPYVLL
jgi:hypothetical protein